MARIVVGSYMIRYPLGGMLSWSLQWLVGLRRLGHEVFFVEKGHYREACYDPTTQRNGDDPSYGAGVVDALLRRHGLADQWTFVDVEGRHFGRTRAEVHRAFCDADLFLDLGTHGSWMEEAEPAGMRVLVDGEPGYTQMKMELRAVRGVVDPVYDHYFTNGANLETGASTSPMAGRRWRGVFNPAVLELFDSKPGKSRDPVTTVMNWQAHDPLVYKGITYGQKDVEFERFLELPRLTSAALEIAVSGDVPGARLRQAGWGVRSAQEVTTSFDAYRDYLSGSSMEFSVCKTGYVTTNSGWFSDRSAAYMATGRPVIMQETGFSAHLPCGEGLFAVRTPDEAAAAIDQISADYEHHARRAKEIAREYLAADKVLTRFLAQTGL